MDNFRLNSIIVLVDCDVEAILELEHILLSD